MSSFVSQRFDEFVVNSIKKSTSNKISWSDYKSKVIINIKKNNSQCALIINQTPKVIIVSCTINNKKKKAFKMRNGKV